MLCSVFSLLSGVGQSICKSNEFQCKSGVCNRKGCKGKPCIPIEWVNDDPENPDCTDGSDEGNSYIYLRSLVCFSHFDQVRGLAELEASRPASWPIISVVVEGVY